jgi:type I restriction enzyme R subunit
MNEAEARAEHVDPALAAAGWGVIEGSRVRREYPITLGRLEGQGRRGKPITADYLLIYRNTKLAIIEAKAWDEALTEGVAQAKNYAGKLAVRYAYHSTGRPEVVPFNSISCGLALPAHSRELTAGLKNGPNRGIITWWTA